MPAPASALRRLPLLLLAGLSLLAGLDAALLLLGLPAPVTTDRLPDVHGMLMVLGFVGTLIALERAVALRRWWGFGAPVLLGLGALALLSPLPLTVGRGLLTAGAVVLVVVYVPLFRRSRDTAVLVQQLGAVAAACGALLWWAGAPMPATIPWLTAFVVTTIAGERLELARVAMSGLRPGDRTRADSAILAVCVATVLGAAAATAWPGPGHAVLGAALLALCAWLAGNDVARRTVRSRGLPRFTAACLLAAYAWLAVAGGIWLLGGPQLAGRGYDAVLHSVFFGFTISMIMAHAPIILPAVLRVPLPYHPAMYGPAALLHVTLVLRVAVGDARDVPALVTIGGIGNVVALLGFVVTNVIVGVVASRRAPTARAARGTRDPEPALPSPVQEASAR
ncbi:hypothetical protein IGS67_02120 [Flavimobilis sp. GY10621]|uniref:Uncharacterized protein n=1 Tax=Flavimobilis rhizosphaerae TaxID=2775421 RepID=A0ABR9DQN3_9MICO|nr:hypothetical protein [Flavimobilis rhizosphaerae]MBD9698290.1 hypothetical protein [Flavimobilis rhizosphaerae]